MRCHQTFMPNVSKHVASLQTFILNISKYVVSFFFMTYISKMRYLYRLYARYQQIYSVFTDLHVKYQQKCGVFLDFHAKYFKKVSLQTFMTYTSKHEVSQYTYAALLQHLFISVDLHSTSYQNVVLQQSVVVGDSKEPQRKNMALFNIYLLHVQMSLQPLLLFIS